MAMPLGTHDASLPIPTATATTVTWLHCPVVADSDGDTTPLPAEYCVGLLSEYLGLPANASPASSHHSVAVTASRAVPPEAATKQASRAPVRRS